MFRGVICLGQTKGNAEQGLASNHSLQDQGELDALLEKQHCPRDETVSARKHARSIVLDVAAPILATGTTQVQHLWTRVVQEAPSHNTTSR